MLRRTALHLGRLSSGALARSSASVLHQQFDCTGSDSERTSRSQHAYRLPQFKLPISSFGLLETCHFSTSSHAATSSSWPELPPTELELILQADRVAEAAAFVAAKADAWIPTTFFINLLDFMHMETMWPWWAVIASTNIAIRLATLPVAVFTQKQAAKMVVVNQDMAELKEIQAAASRADDYKQYEVLSKQLAEKQAEVMTKHGKTLKKTMLMPVMSIMNAGVFISLFAALNKLAAEKVPSMSHGGALWFTDLTVPDPYLGIPIFCCLVTIAMVEMGAMSSEMAMPPETMRKMSWFLRFIALMFIPAGQYVPSGVGVLWVSNSLFGIFQSVLFRIKGARQILGLPDLKATQKLMDSSKAVLGGKAGGSSSPSMSDLGNLLGTGSKGGPVLPPPPAPKPRLLDHRPKPKRR